MGRSFSRLLGFSFTAVFSIHRWIKVFQEAFLSFDPISTGTCDKTGHDFAINIYSHHFHRITDYL